MGDWPLNSDCYPYELSIHAMWMLHGGISEYVIRAGWDYENKFEMADYYDMMLTTAKKEMRKLHDWAEKVRPSCEKPMKRTIALIDTRLENLRKTPEWQELNTFQSKKKVKREVTKFSRKTEQLTGEYPINCSVKEMCKLFNVGDDLDMYACYPIEYPEQIAFFRKQGVPITKKSDWFVEAYAE